jgi:hypothetical protein
MQCILCKIYFFGNFFTSTIIWYAFLYALLFAQNFILAKSECYRRRSWVAAPKWQLFSFCWIWYVCLSFVELDVKYIRWINSMYIYVIRYINFALYICYELLICSLEFWLTECRMCFKLEIKCRFLSSSYGWADVSLSVITVALVTMDRWCQRAHR